MARSRRTPVERGRQPGGGSPPDDPGQPTHFYLDILHETREKTLAQLKTRDDAWLLAVDRDFTWGPTNNYCKWFHVCEHESNHNGQIRWIKSRLGK
jgi:hypothetical protein